MKVLIVDDKKENRYLLETLLKGKGYETVSAANGVEALEKLRGDNFDLIVSDILMPDMDGFQLCRECKSDDMLKKIPFVFYTATYTEKKDEKFALSLGADKFILKPMKPEQFTEIIKGVLENFQKGLLRPPEVPVRKEEPVYLKEYNECLIRKLEDKMLALEKANHDLAERVKELNCLHGLTGLVEKPGISLEGILQGTVDLIPPAWQYPEVTCARITFGNKEFKTAKFKTTKWRLSADIKLSGVKAGTLEAYYLKEKPQDYEGPFLEEKRNLIEALAERLGRIAERKQAEAELKAANQQLQASEQQLRASNQQLRASEQQLKASNQQLRANEQQLRAEVAERKKAQEELFKKARDLAERVKELTYLYGLSRIIEKPGISLEGIFQAAVDSIPPAWQYPEVTCARIIFKEKEFKTDNFKITQWKQTAEIKVHGKITGSVEVYYLEEKPVLYEGPFLKEERDLIESITERLGRIAERKKAEKRIREMNETFLSFGVDADENINSIVKFCGETLGATCALYNRLEGDMFCSLGQWNTPPDYKSQDRCEGRICYDVIKEAGKEIFVVRNLLESKYAQTDPNVKRYDLQTYIGQAVKSEGRYVGSLCVVYQKDFKPAEDDKRLMGILASVIGTEEESKQAVEAIRQERNMVQKYLDLAPVIFVSINSAGEVVLINRKGCEVLGSSEEDILGKNWFNNFVPERIKKEILTISAKLFADEIEPTEYFENPVLTKNNKERMIAWHNTVIRDDEDRIIGHLSAGADITEHKKAEEQLRDSEERFRILFEYAPDAYYLLNLDGVFIDGNRAAEEIIGHKREDLIGKNFIKMKLLNNNDIAKAIANLGQNALGISTGPSEYVLNRKDGSNVTVEINSYPVKIQGKIQVLGIARDITKRKKAENIFRIQHNMAMELSTVSSLEDGLRLCLDAAIEVSDMDCGGAYMVDEKTGAINLIVEKKLPVEFVDSAKHMEADTPNVQLVMKGKPIYSKYKKPGIKLNEVKLKKKLRAIGVIPIVYEKHVIGYINIASHRLDEVPVFSRDIIETIVTQSGSTIVRLRVEAALRQSEEEYRSLVENVNFGVYRDTGGPKGKFLKANPAIARIFGYDQENFMQLHVSELYRNPEDRKKFIEAIIENGFVKDYELRLKRKDGTPIWGSCTAKIKYGETGDIMWMDGVIEDITERKKTEEELLRTYNELNAAYIDLQVIQRSLLEEQEERRSLMKRQLSIQENERKSISRELHDQLGSSLSGLLFMLEAMKKNNFSVTENFARDFEGLIKNTIAVAHGMSSSLRPLVLDDAGLDSALIEYFELIERNSGIAIKYCNKLASNLDRQHDEIKTGIYRIIQEGLSNALSHSGADKVEVTLKEEKNSIALSIVDNGVGFDVNEKKKNRRLGLIGMRERAILMGGTLEISSGFGEGVNINAVIPKVQNNAD